METEQEFNTTMKVVKSLLETENKCRESDKWLIIETLRSLGFKIYIDYKEIPNMPSFETITRCARKIKEEYPELRPSNENQEYKENKMNIIRELMKPTNRNVEIKTFIKPTRGIEIFTK